MPLAIGSRLGPYEIVAPLGAGAMGEVYKARDTRLDRFVAIKVLPAAVAGDAQRHERFRREARAISTLTHPHICTLYDVGEHDGVDFLVMEYLAGETLAQRLLRGAVPLEQVLRIAAQIADGLAAAHQHGIVHRDLKPSNVMLTPGGTKVLDFGLAKRSTEAEIAIADSALLAAPATITHPGTIVGTVQYMAPEQLEGKAADARSDIFAFGAIVYEMTTGRKAFAGESSASIMAEILTAMPSPMTISEPLTPPALDRAVGKALAKDPAKRWQAAADLRDELTWILEDLRGPAQNAPATTRTTRRYGALTLAIAIGLAIAALLAVLARTRSETPAPVRFVVLPPEKTTGALVPIISPDGRKLVFVARTLEGKSSLWVRSLDALESKPIADADDLAFPFWSADSQSIGFFAQGKLKRVDATGGPSVVICDAPSPRGGAWNRDGVILFAPIAEAALYRVSAAGGSPVAVTTLDKASGERSHRFPQFLSDGRHFVYTVYFGQASRKPSIQARSLDSPNVSTLIEGGFARAWSPPGYLVYKRQVNGPYFAQPFDHRTLHLSGDPQPLVDHVAGGAKGGEFAFSVSDNGVVAYETVTGEGLAKLSWLDRTGKPLKDVATISLNAAFSLSPTGQQLATVRLDAQPGVRSIWITDFVRGGTSRLTSGGFDDDPVWAPDGARLAFDSIRGTGNPDLYLTSLSGADRELLVSPQGKYLSDWSRDGRLLLFQIQEGDYSVDNIWILELEGNRKPQPFLQTHFDKENPRFAPDTRWIAYDTAESGRSEVYVQSFPDAAFRSQVSTAGGHQPRWRRDGKELYYITDEGALMAVPVQTRPAFAAAAPVELFRISAASPTAFIDAFSAGIAYDVTADGQRFLVKTLVQAPVRSPMTVVLNWTAELKK